jgi:hypothetical protein
MYPYAHSLSRCWVSRPYTICHITVLSFDLEPARKLLPNPCHRAFVLHPLTPWLHLLSIYPHVPSSGRFWRPRYDAICCDTVISFDLGQERQLSPNSCPRAFVLHLSACCLRLECPPTRTSIHPVDAAIQDIMPSTPTLFFSFDPEPARQLDPISCHHTFVPHPSACRLRLLSMYSHVQSSDRCCNPRHHAI